MNDSPDITPARRPDAMVIALQWLIRMAVRVLAVMMTVVILFGVWQVGLELMQRFEAEPRYTLTFNDMLATFGSFMAVLIAIEIFINITIYLDDHSIHVRVVMGTALMAIARKIIILDKSAPEDVYALAALMLAMSIGYGIAMITTRHDEHDTGIAKTVPPGAIAGLEDFARAVRYAQADDAAPDRGPAPHSTVAPHAGGRESG